jgi:hypothetical protein
MKLDMAEIDKYINLANGDMTSICHRGANIQSTNEVTRYPIIPCRIRGTRDEADDADYEVADTILRALRNGTLENPNDPRDEETIVNVITTICEARCVAPRLRIEEQNELVKCLAFHEGWNKNGPKALERKQKFESAFASIQEAFELKQARNYGMGFGSASKTNDVLVVWKPKGSRDIYLYMFIERNYQQKVVPHTTGREVFGRASASNGCLPSMLPETQSCARILEEDLLRFIQMESDNAERWSDKNKSITSNRPLQQKHIYLNLDVFAELPAIKDRFKTKGIQLAWKKASGKSPNALGNIVRLSEITWEGTLPKSCICVMGATILEE